MRVKLFVLSLVAAVVLWAAASSGGLYTEDTEGVVTKLVVTCDEVDHNMMLVKKWGVKVEDGGIECGPADDVKCASYYITWEFLSGLYQRWENLKDELGCTEA